MRTRFTGDDSHHNTEVSVFNVYIYVLCTPLFLLTYFLHLT